MFASSKRNNSSVRRARLASFRPGTFFTSTNAKTKRERSHSFFEFFLFPILNARRGPRRRRLWISFLARFWVNEMISKRSIHSKKENENGERERVTSLVSFERERERENETFIPRSTRSNSCWRRLIFFLFFSPTALSGMDKIFVSFSQNTHKISLSLSNATM